MGHASGLGGRPYLQRPVAHDAARRTIGVRVLGYTGDLPTDSATKCMCSRAATGITTAHTVPNLFFWKSTSLEVRRTLTTELNTLYILRNRNASNDSSFWAGVCRAPVNYGVRHVCLVLCRLTTFLGPWYADPDSDSLRPEHMSAVPAGEVW